MKSKIFFGDKKVEKSLEITDQELKRQLEKAFKNLEENAFCGIQIPKKLFPKEYIKRFGILTNLWKYNLPGA